MIDAKLADNNVNNRELFWRSLPGVAVNIDCGGYDKLVYTNETHELFRWNDQIEKFEVSGFSAESVNDIH